MKGSMKQKAKKLLKKITYEKILKYILYIFSDIAFAYSLFIFKYRPVEEVYYNVLTFVCAGLTVFIYEIGQYRYESLKELLTKTESEVTEYGKQSE